MITTNNPSTPTSSSSQTSNDEDACLICLTSPIANRCILPRCSHSLFCFHCILTWIQVSSASATTRATQDNEQGEAKCPLCNGEIGQYILHTVQSGKGPADVHCQRWWLPRSSASRGRDDVEVNRAARRSIWEERRRRRRRQEDDLANRTRAAAHSNQAELDFARQVTQRREIYYHQLYAKHLGSNPTTGLSSPPSPSAIRSQPYLLSPALPSFLRRELLALPLWSCSSSALDSSMLDIPFLTTYLLSLLQHLDVRSEGFLKLLSELLGDGSRERALARHFTHELATFLRLGNKGTVKRFDRIACYDVPGDEKEETDDTAAQGYGRREQEQGEPSTDEGQDRTGTFKRRKRDTKPREMSKVEKNNTSHIQSSHSRSRRTGSRAEDAGVATSSLAIRQQQQQQQQKKKKTQVQHPTTSTHSSPIRIDPLKALAGSSCPIPFPSSRSSQGSPAIIDVDVDESALDQRSIEVTRNQLQGQQPHHQLDWQVQEQRQREQELKRRLLLARSTILMENPLMD